MPKANLIKELGWSDIDFETCARHLTTNEMYRTQLVSMLGATAYELGINTVSKLSEIYWIPIDDLHQIEAEIWSAKKPRKLSKQVIEKLAVPSNTTVKVADPPKDLFEAYGINDAQREMMNAKCLNLFLKEPEVFMENKFVPKEESTSRAGVSYRFKPQTVDILKLASAGTNQTITAFLEDLIKYYSTEYMLGWIQRDDQQQPEEEVHGMPGVTAQQRSADARNAIKTYNILQARHNHGQDPSLYFVNEEGESTNPLTPHGKKHDPHLGKRKFETPKYKDLLLQVTDFLSAILTWMAGNQEIVGDLLRLQKDMRKGELEMAGDPESFQAKMSEWNDTFIDIRESMHHIGEERVAKVPEDNTPQTDDFDPRD